MEVRPDYDEFNPTDVEPVGMDFAKDLAPGETITSATVSLIALSGTDGDLQSHLTEDPAIIGTVVSIMLSHLIGGVKYRVIFVVTTPIRPGITLYCDVYCRDPAARDACEC